ncbi:MAG: DUF2334 domain-containing protein [Acidobacteriota bacterium]
MTGKRRAERIKVVLRYDDYSALSDFAIEEAILDVLRRHGLRAVFGVIPFAVPVGSCNAQEEAPLEGKKANALRSSVQEGLVEAALHGCQHQYLPRFNYLNGYTEFEGLPVAEQSELIARGNAELERITGSKARCFIPPFNSYDEGTIEALRQNGIKCLSAAVFDPVPGQAELLLVPHTCSLPQLREAVELARQGSSAAPIVVALFHSFDFVESGQKHSCISMKEFDALITWLARQDDVDVVTVSRMMDSGDDLGIARYQANRRLRRMGIHPLVPPSEYTRRTRVYYPEQLEGRSLVVGAFLVAMFTYFACAAAGLFSSFAVTSIFGISKGIVTLIFGLGVGIWFSLLFLRGGVVYSRAAQVSVFLVFCFVGGLLWA